MKATLLVPLTDLPSSSETTIIAIRGGHGMRRRLRSMGIAEGRTIRKLSALAWGGPIVVLVNRTQIAIGRGMANKVLVRATDVQSTE